MDAGRELDALVAEKVIGLKLAPRQVYAGGKVADPECWHSDIDGRFIRAVPPYSTDIAAAWEVVEKMQHDGLWTVLHSDWHGNRRCTIARRSEIILDDLTWHPTAPLAICLAALRAVGAMP